MATQTIEFNATTGLTLTAKMFALGSDTVAGTASATEKTNHKGRYTAEFTDLASGEYMLDAFVSSTGGFAIERYSLLMVTDTYYPDSEDLETVQQPVPVSAVVL